MHALKKTLSESLLVLTIALLFSPAAFAQLTVLSYSPAATETPAGSHYYVINDPIAHDDIDLTWNFSKGLDRTFVQDINNITVKEKGSSTEIKFDNSTGTTTPTATGGLIITNADFIYTKEGSGSDPVQIRQLELKPTTVSFEADKTYVVTIYNSLNGNNFQSNNSNILDATYSFEFATIAAPASSSTTTSAAATSTTTSVAGTSTTTSVEITTCTTTTTAPACIFVQAFAENNAQELAAFRLLRDTRLLWSIRGFLYVLQYYYHAPEVCGIFNDHPDLLLRFRQVALSITPRMEGALRSGREIKISPAQYREVLSLMEDIAIHASPVLKKTITAAYGDLTAGVIQKKFGIVVTED